MPLLKLDHIDDLEEQLIELRDDKQRLQRQEEHTCAEKTFPEQYDFAKAQLTNQLRQTQTELDLMRDTFQPAVTAEDRAEASENEKDPF